MYKALLLLFFALKSFSAYEITLGTFLIPKYVTSDTEGEFIRLVKMIEKDSGVKINIKILPPARTRLLFLKGELDGYFPSLDIFGDEDIIKTKPFYYKKDYLFHLSTQKITKLKNKDICLTNGYAYAKDITNDKSVRFHYASSDLSCFKMLLKKRVDATICEGITGVNSINELNTKSISVNPTPLYTNPVYFAFQKSKKGENLVKLFNQSLSKKKKNSTLKNLFKDARKSVEGYLNDYDPTVP